MREVIQSRRFKRDYKKIAASGRYLVGDFLLVVELLAQDESMPTKYRDHALYGEWSGYRGMSRQARLAANICKIK